MAQLRGLVLFDIRPDAPPLDARQRNVGRPDEDVPTP
jgi:hypothetical protein